MFPNDLYKKSSFVSRRKAIEYSTVFLLCILCFFAVGQTTMPGKADFKKQSTTEGIYNLSAKYISNSSSIKKVKGGGSPPQLASIITGTICEGQCVAIQAKVEGGTPPYTVTWNTGQTGEGPHIVCPTTTTLYFCTVIDANGNTDFDIDQIIITVVPSITSVSVTQNNVSCNGGSNGSLSLVPSGGTPQYSYQWFPGGQTTSGINGLTADTYTVVIQDKNSCWMITDFTITEPNALSISITGQTNVKCNGNNTGGVTVNAAGGAGGYTYNWSNGKGGPINNNINAGVYTVTVTDDNGCTKTKAITITEPNALSISISGQTNVKCNGDNTGGVTVNAAGGAGGYTYNWSNGKGGPINNNINAGVYTVTVTDDNGCTKTKAITITEPNALSISISGQTNVKCNGDNTGGVTVNAAGGAGGYTYNWSNGKGGPINNNINAGVYTVTVTDDNGCTKTKAITITEPNALSISITGQTNVKCNGNSTGGVTVIAAGGAGGYTYTWSNGKGGPINNNINAGVYTVTVTDDNACTETKNITITEPNALSISISGQTNVKCNGNSTGGVTVSAAGGAGGYAYTWSNGKIGAINNNIIAGVYTVTVTDDNGCTETKNITITEPNALSISITGQTNVKCNGNNTGGVTVIATGGAGGYTYNWSNGKIGAINNNIVAGVYTVTVTDDNACTETKVITITEPNAPVTATVTTTDATCGQNNGTADVTNVSGGTSGYSYSWSSGGNTQTENNLGAGVYTVTISDANGCPLEEIVNVNNSTGPAINSIATTSVNCFGDATGSATVNASGNSLTYLWSNNETNNTINNLTAAVYSLTVTDGNGCKAIANMTIDQPSAPLAATLTTTDANCGKNNGTADVTNVNGGIPSYTYAWSSGGIAPTETNLGAGTFTVTITDANSCTLEKDASIIDNGSIITTSGSITICSGQSVMIHGISQNAAGVYSQTFVAIGGCDSISDVILIVNNPTNSSITTSACNSYILNGQTYNATGIYTQTLINATGCDSIITLDLTINGTINTSDALTICAGQSVMIHGISQNTAGIYSQTFVANGGCDSISDVTLIVNNPTTNNITVGACSNYSLNGQTYNTTGIYTQTLINVAGCDSIITLDLTINGTINTSGTISICSGQSAMIHGISQNTAGIYSQTFVAIGGCDSISDVTLVVNNNITTSGAISICSGQSAIIHGINQTIAGIYSQTFVANGGCDSISDITLVVSNNITTSGTVTICSGQSAMIHGVNQTLAGIYSQTFVAIGGCDSISDVTLIVNNPTTNNITVGACSNYSLNGQTYNTTGIYTQTLISAAGCDSIITLDLTINGTINTSGTISICSGQSAMIHGISQNTAGIYSQTFVANGGCDSISDVTLVVNNAINTSSTLTICSGQSAVIHGISQNAAGVYSQTFVANGGCDSISDITLVVKELPIVSFSSDIISGCIPVCVNFTNTTSNTSNLQWDFGDGNTSSIPSPQYCFTNEGSYSITLSITDNNSCSNSTTINNMITVHPSPIAEFATDQTETTITHPNIQFTNLSQGSTIWQWFFEDNNQSSTQQHPYHSYSDSGTYTIQLVVLNEFGCKDSITHDIRINPDYAFYVANAITPNNDGINDIFIPQYMGLNTEGYELRIYNRWGNLIFKTKDIHEGWDARARNTGNFVPQDTYVWTITTKDVFGMNHIYKGNVNVIR